MIGRFPLATVEEAARAVEAADEAFPAWSDTPWADRAHLLFELADRLRRDKHDYSAWMVREVGKKWAEADGDTAEAIDFCEYYAREALRYGKPVPCVQTEDHNECHYVPLGVGVIIAPWNFPLAILCGMTVAALVTGNTIVIKPAEPTLTIGRKFFELIEEVGFPRGVVSFVAGQGRVVGAEMVAHPRTRFVAFTGSKEVGLRLRRAVRQDGPRPALDQADRGGDGRQGRHRGGRQRRPRGGGDGDRGARPSASRARSARPARARSWWRRSTTPCSRR